MANSTDLIKTVANLPWDGIAKILIVAGMFSFLGVEYFEDNADEAEAAQESGHDILVRDLLVANSVRLGAIQDSTEAREARQDMKIEELQDDLEDLQ